MIDRETIDRIYAAANIVDIIGEYVTLKRKGVNYQACCPFHNEKTPSFVVSPSKGVYKWFRLREGRQCRDVPDGAREYDLSRGVESRGQALRYRSAGEGDDARGGRPQR